MSGVEHTDTTTEEVSTSSGDVYTTPIALGFEALVTESAIPTTVYGPANFSDIDTNTSAVSYYKDVRDLNAVRGRCGLYNLGNTCFMNSGLQCLMSTIPMVKFLLHYHEDSKGMDSTLLGQFQTLFAKIWSGRFTVVHPKAFKSTLGIYHSQFQDYRQHDCQEFLALLLDSLHEQLNFKGGHSTNQNTEAGPSSAKQPITFEHNINNRASCSKNLNQAEHDQSVVDKSRNAVTSHSSLTFDNMKDSKTNLNPNSTQTVPSNFTQERSSSESCKTAQNLIPFTVNQISEDSNHSSVSEHSSDSEQCSVMKNLKLRSSPIVSQSSDGLSTKILNDCGAKDCGVSSSDDINLCMLDKAGVENEGFKRVQSLQDFRGKCEKRAMTRASSDNDLVGKASGDIDDEINDFVEELVDNLPGTSQMCAKSTASSVRVGKVSELENTAVSDTSEPVVLNNAISTTNVPSLDDIYSKETKTLNTNVLATEFMDETVATDSHKFAKRDNTSEQSEVIDEEDILVNVIEVTNNKSDTQFEPKRIKDVNIRTEKKGKSPKGACGSSNVMNIEKEDCFALNSVKRMKFEGTEKNLQMQEICKIQKEALLCEALHVNKPGNGEKLSFRKDASPSIESDVESDMIEDPEQEMEMDVSDDNEGNEGPGRGDVVLVEGAVYTASEVMAAEEAWQKYLSKNDSVIVDTFQGQFKSTVVCTECNQVSMTFEPFMYLSVPVPRAMERQLCIIVISPIMEPTQYLLTMHKQDKIIKVKQELCNLIGRQISDIIIAEVLDWHISRILEDNTMLRYINDSSRKLYAFEMDQSCIGSVADNISSSNNVGNPTLSNSQDSAAAQADVFNDVGTFSATSSMTLNQSVSDSSSYYDQRDQSDFVTNSNDLDIIGTGMWEWGTGVIEKRRGSLETEMDDNWLSADSTTVDNSGFDIAEDIAKAINSQSMEVGDKTTISSTDGVENSSDWKSCAICLEELPETELMVHTTCGGTFCSTCLEMSVQHFSEGAYCCPVCSTPAEITEDFVPLTNAASHKPKTRIVAIPIAYRCERDTTGIIDGPYLFAHPSILNLPSNLTGEHISSCIRRLQPDIGEFRVLLTDGTGLRCSRCLYMEHCTGCEISLDGEAILRPGDHLAVSVQTVGETHVRDGQRIGTHKSMENQQSNDPLTLMDCFNAFTQSEELDEHNPWFCPHCKQNQRAKKTMTVWQYPDTLIIQLKRFVFHELSSTKVDNKVIFPVDSLDLNNFISGPNTKNLVYNLYSLVCHFGGANSGHYTSYAKHPVDGKWYYYNDETVTECIPGEDEFSSTYVLFYQRKGTDRALQIPDELDICVESDSPDLVATGSFPCLHFSPSEADIALECSKGEITPNDSSTAPSTSCHTVAPSTGSCDLFIAKETDENDKSGHHREGFIVEADQSDQRGEGFNADSCQVRAELAEADSSTEGTFEFYT